MRATPPESEDPGHEHQRRGGNGTPAYVLLASDWLVEKFGLAANVEGAAPKR